MGLVREVRGAGLPRARDDANGKAWVTGEDPAAAWGARLVDRGLGAWIWDLRCIVRAEVLLKLVAKR